MRWWEADPRRLEEELTVIVERFPRMCLVNRPDGALGLDGLVQVGEAWRGLRLTWPETYPDQPPEIVEVEAFSEEIVDHAGTGHQLADGALCLYTHDGGPDGWRPDRTAADALDRYVSFVRTGAALPEWAPPMVLGLPLNGVFRISPALAQIAHIPGGWGVATVGLTPGEAAGQVLQMQRAPHLRVAHTWNAPEAWHRHMRPLALRVPWVCVKMEGRPWSSIGRDGSEFDLWLRARLPGDAFPMLQVFPWVMLSREEGEATDLIMVQRSQLGVPFGSVSLEIADARDLLFQRVDGAMSGRDALQRAQVVLVGLGSLGSRVAISLATAGVGRFLLFDPERLGPENVCRHAAGLSHLDRPKVEAVGQLILDRNPDAQVQVVPTGLVWDGPHRTAESGLAFARALEDPETLVVVTVAQHRLEATINRRCVRAGRSAIYASVLGPGAHGRIFRALPGESPCYACVLLAQRLQPERFWSLSAEEGAAAPRMAPYAQPGIPGLGVDVDTIALLTARLALQTLARSRPEVGYPDQEGHHLLWSNRGGWGFDHPLQLRVEPYERQPDCLVCGAGASQGLSAQERDALLALEQRLRDPGRMAPEAPTIRARRAR